MVMDWNDPTEGHVDILLISATNPICRGNFSNPNTAPFVSKAICH